MKKITLLIAVLGLVVFMQAQVITDFESDDNVTVGGWGYTETPTIADDGTGNMAIKVVKDSDDTFAQGITIVFTTPVVPDAGNTRITASISGIAGARGYAKVYQAGVETYNNWWSKEDGSTLSANDTYEEFVLDGISADGIDSMYIHLGGWDNGNAPEGLQGTYYIDNITAVAPPAVIVAPRVVVEIDYIETPVSIDGLPTEAEWLNAETFDIVNYDSANYEGSFAANFKALWDLDYLYLLLTATDATATEYDGDVDTWKRDGFQGYWDVRNQLLEGRRDNATQHQINFGYGNSVLTGWQGDIVDAIYNNAENSMQTEWADQPIGGGYIIELRVPWAAMYYDGINIDTWDLSLAAVDIQNGDTIGFDIQANDYNPATDSRDVAMTWSAYSNDSPGGWQNSGVWGGLKLVNGPVSVSDSKAIETLSIYPNPAVDVINIDLDVAKVEIYNMIGSKVVESTDNLVDVSELTKGIYLIQVTQSSGAIAIGKFNKE